MMPDAQRAEIAKLEALHTEHPEGRIFTHLAEAYRKAGELERARDVLAQGIERHPDYSSAHVVLARVLVDQGETAAAEAEFRRVLELDAHNLVALRSLGDLARSAGRTDQALDFYRRLLDVEPSDEDVLALVAQVEEGADAGEETATVAGTGESTEAFSELALSPGEELGAEGDAAQDFAAPGEAAEAPDALEPREDHPPLGETAPLGEGTPDEEDQPLPEAAPYGESAALEPDAGFDESTRLEEGTQFDPSASLGGSAPPEETASLEEPAGAGTGAQEPEGAAGPSDAARQSMEHPGPEDRMSAGYGADDDGYAPPADLGEPGMLTETIAQVYARQGLYDRAAEVYRQLLRTRPDDAMLRARMEEMETLAGSAPGAGTPESVPALEPLEPEPESEPLEPEAPAGEPEPLESEPVVFDRSGEGYPFDADPDSAAGAGSEPMQDFPDIEPLPGLETAESAAAPDVPPISGLEMDEVDPETGLRTEEPSWEPWSEIPAAEGAPEEADVSGETVEAADVGAAGDFGVVGGIEPGAAEADAAEPDAEAVESVWTGAAGAADAEETPYAWADGETEEDPSEPIGTYFRSLLDWSPPAAGGPASPVESAPGAATPPEGDAGERVGGGTDAGASGGATPGPGGESPDDDDLDTFRSWLESLKQ